MSEAETWLWGLRRQVAAEHRLLRKEKARIRREEAIRRELERCGLPSDAQISFHLDSPGEAEIILPGGSSSVWVRWNDEQIEGFVVNISEGMRVFNSFQLIHAIKFAFSLDLDLDDLDGDGAGDDDGDGDGDDDGDGDGDGAGDDDGDDIPSEPLLQVAVITGETAEIAYFWYPPS